MVVCERKNVGILTKSQHFVTRPRGEGKRTCNKRMPERKTKREDELFIFAFEVCPAHYAMSDNFIARAKRASLFL